MHFRPVGWFQTGVVWGDQALALAQLASQLITIFHRRRVNDSRLIAETIAE